MPPLHPIPAGFFCVKSKIGEAGRDVPRFVALSRKFNDKDALPVHAAYGVEWVVMIKGLKERIYIVAVVSAGTASLVLMAFLLFE
jgi:hypothetical protein